MFSEVSKSENYRSQCYPNFKDKHEGYRNGFFEQWHNRNVIVHVSITLAVEENDGDVADVLVAREISAGIERRAF